MRAARVDRAAVRVQFAEESVQQLLGLGGLAAAAQDIRQFHLDLGRVQGGPLRGQHVAGGAQFGLGAGQVAVLGVHVAAHPVAVRELRADLELLVDLGGLGE